MKKIILLLSLLLFLVSSGLAYAQEQVSDYFYPEGNSGYYIYKDLNSGPVEKISVRYERNSEGGRLEESSPIPLIGNITYSRPMEKVFYLLDITDTTVTARSRWTQQNLSSGQMSAAVDDSISRDLVLLKLPADKETITWTTTVNKDGNILQIWEMSAKRKMISAKENGAWIAVHTLEVIRNVFDAQHNPIPRENVTEYWRKGKGKIKVIRNK
ncbi:MAG: hypothetical protein IJ056_05940 [Acidaminococcaceae bacterium]|nr:hypothetical protein [Acidaminococcaceae bacterium]